MPPKPKKKTLSARPTSLLSIKGKRRKDTILDAAIEQLVSKGGDGFSMNRVAAKAGISLGNLQYYFPTRSNLIESMLERMRDHDLNRLEKAAMEVGDDPMSRLEVLVESQLESSNNIRDVKVVAHLWSVSLYNDDLNRIQDRWYAEYRDLLTQILMELHPKRPSSELELLSTVIISLIEGSSILVGAGRVQHEELAGYDDELRRRVFELATA